MTLSKAEAWGAPELEALAKRIVIDAWFSGQLEEPSILSPEDLRAEFYWNLDKRQREWDPNLGQEDRDFLDDRLHRIERRFMEVGTESTRGEKGRRLFLVEKKSGKSRIVEGYSGILAYAGIGRDRTEKTSQEIRDMLSASGIRYHGIREPNISSRKRDRQYRARKSPRSKGERSHQRNYRPEIPNCPRGYSGIGSFPDLESVLSESQEVKYFQNDRTLYANIVSGDFQGTYAIGKIAKFSEVQGRRFEPKDNGVNIDPMLIPLLASEHNGTFFYDGENFYFKVEVKNVQAIYLLDVKKDMRHVDSDTLRPIRNSTVQAMLDYLDDEVIIPRYSRNHSREPPQTMPKIPWRDLGKLRDNRGGHRDRYQKPSTIHKAPSPESYKIHLVPFPEKKNREGEVTRPAGYTRHFIKVA